MSLRMKNDLNKYRWIGFVKYLFKIYNIKTYTIFTRNNDKYLLIFFFLYRPYIQLMFLYSHILFHVLRLAPALWK